MRNQTLFGVQNQTDANQIVFNPALLVGTETEFTSDIYIYRRGGYLEEEYYEKQYEENKNLSECQLINVPKLIGWSIKKIVSLLQYTVYEDDLDYGTVYFSDIVFSGYSAIVWNGQHLTLDKRYLRNTSGLDINKVISTIRFDSFRKLYSHHIHGAYRSSEYRFKQKEKFKPVLEKEEFFELRYVDTIDFIDPRRFSRRIEEIKKLFFDTGQESINSEKVELLKNLSSDYVGNLEDVLQFLSILKNIIIKEVPVYYIRRNWFIERDKEDKLQKDRLKSKLFKLKAEEFFKTDIIEKIHKTIIVKSKKRLVPAVFNGLIFIETDENLIDFYNPELVIRYTKENDEIEVFLQIRKIYDIYLRNSLKEKFEQILFDTIESKNMNHITIIE